MKYQVNDQINGPQIFEVEAQAQAALLAAQAAFLAREDYRFPLAFVEVDGNNTVWRNFADSDPDNGDYRAFNHNTGQYELFTSKLAAQLRIQELKSLLLADVWLDKVYEYIAPPPIAPTIPSAVL